MLPFSRYVSLLAEAYCAGSVSNVFVNGKKFVPTFEVHGTAGFVKLVNLNLFGDATGAVLTFTLGGACPNLPALAANSGGNLRYSFSEASEHKCCPSTSVNVLPTLGPVFSSSPRPVASPSSPPPLVVAPPPDITSLPPAVPETPLTDPDYPNYPPEDGAQQVARMPSTLPTRGW